MAGTAKRCGWLSMMARILKKLSHYLLMHKLFKDTEKKGWYCSPVHTSFYYLDIQTQVTIHSIHKSCYCIYNLTYQAYIADVGLFFCKSSACSVGWWLMAGAGLFWEKSTAGWLLMADLFWEKSTAGWWLISQANRVRISKIATVKMD
jgi:hypothetical protein